MDDDEKFSTSEETSNKGLWGAIVILICAVAVALGYALYQHGVTGNLSSANQEAETKLAQTSQEVQALSQKLNTMESQAAAEAAAREAETAKHARTPGRTAHARRRPADDHWKKVQAELAEHQKEIDSTRQNLDSTRSEFANNLDAARSELGGSIAKTHDELVALEKKGERNYYEFNIAKTRQFNHAGPLSIKLRKANTKHDYADLELIVDDREMTKKHLNIYEPVVFYPADSKVPVELVINGIDKNLIHGYVSTPKYTPSELAGANSAANMPAGPATTAGAADAANSNAGAPAPAATPAPATPGELEHRPAPQD